MLETSGNRKVTLGRGARVLVAAALALLFAWVVPPPSEVCGQGANDGLSSSAVKKLRKITKDAPLVVLGKIKSLKADPTISQRLAWELTAQVVEVLKGKLTAKEITIHVESPVSSFDMSRAKIPGNTFLMPIKQLRPAASAGTGPGVGSRFQLSAERVFLQGTKEEKTVRKMIAGKFMDPSAAKLKLTIQATEKVFTIGKPVLIKVRLANEGASSAIYLQSPIMEHRGVLYLMAKSSLSIRDGKGRSVPDKGTVVFGVPPSPSPAIILSGADHALTVDLGKYFEMGREGEYVMSLALPSPYALSIVRSNKLTFRVTPRLASTNPRTKTAKAVQRATIKRAVPEYKPGRVVGGLCGLLKPTKEIFRVGQPVLIEFRLLNATKPVLNIDTRLERTLTLFVREKKGSFPVRGVRQIIGWPLDAAGKHIPLAWLVRDAFWGRTLNINSLYGIDAAALEPPSSEAITGKGPFSYETFGKTLFGFENPGRYEVMATYSCRRQAGDSTPNLWTGTLTTNTISVTIVGKSAPARKP